VLVRVARQLNVALEDATEDDLDVWQAQLKVGPSSVMTYTAHVRAFYAWAHESGRIATNPAERLILPRLNRRLPRPIPEQDLRLALITARGDLVAILVLAGYLGLRAGEIAAVTRDDLIDRGELSVLIVHGKGGQERAMPIPDEALRLLRPMLTCQGPIFRTPTGLPADGNYVSRVVSAHLRGIGLPYTCHQLRHRFGTVVYGMCRDLRQTQELMGHAHPDTTAGYVAVSAPEAARTVRRLGERIPRDITG
jgi:integrase